MSYSLRHEESLGENIRRICRKQIECASAIVTGAAEPNDSAVHQTRKHLKKARAALRLIHKEIGRGFFREQDHRLRDVARLISDIRDAEVRLQTVREVEAIMKRRRRAASRKLELMLALELENFMAAFAEWQAQALPLLEQARDAVDAWSLGHFDCKQLRCAVQTTYKCARRRLADARAAKSANAFHEFRTAAKLLWQQLRILRPTNPAVLTTLCDDLRSLGDLLGRAHDLSFLSERLRNEHGKSDWQREGRKLLAVIEVSETDLQRAAAELAERFFAERPRDFGARIAGFVEAWLDEAGSSITPALVA
jgi:CHAD domain-containing protein